MNDKKLNLEDIQNSSIEIINKTAQEEVKGGADSIILDDIASF